ncbi:hypothetical protein CCP4SC76_3010028 [Gammaproteobacteria bacterium]
MGLDPFRQISSCAPTGRNEIAQGNALGLTGYRTPTRGVAPGYLMMPLRGAKKPDETMTKAID